MDYIAFKIQNFKGIRHLEFSLDTTNRGRITTLIGLNESGKTTVLEAIDLFAGGSAELDPKQLNGRIRPAENDLVPVAERANFNGRISIGATVRLSSLELAELRKHLKAKLDYRLASATDEFVVTDIYDYANSIFKEKKTMWSFRGMGRAKGERKDWELTLTNYPEVWKEAVSFLRARLPTIWYFPNFLFDFPSRIYLTPLSEDSPADRFYRVLIQDILDSLDIDAAVQEHLADRAVSTEAADRRALDNLVLRMGRKITDDVFSGWNRMFGRRVDKKVVLRIDVDIRTDASGTEVKYPYLEFQIEDNDGFFFVHERSLGFRWFFVFLLLTTFRGSRKGADGGILFLFDEPASNLHPSAQAQLRASFEKLVERCRIIYTTHSHHMIDPDWLEQTYVVRNRGLDDDGDEIDYTAKRTDIVMDRYRTFANRHPDQSRYFQPVLDVLNYSPSKLELVPSVVMVEGKNDYYTLRLGDRITGESSPQLNFMPGTGAGSLDQLISLYLGWGRDFIILLDSDGEGEYQKKRYVDRFGVELEARIFTLGDLEPSLAGGPLEGVFEDSDRRSILMTADPGLDQVPTDKKSLNRAIQEALIRRLPITLTDGANAAFSSILHALRERLDKASEDRTSEG